jgi:predicted membrane protein
MMDALDRPMARRVSLLTAAAVAGLITIYPRALVNDEHVNHGLLMLLLWGASAGFVHGVGFVPEHRVLRLLLGPLVAWPLLAGGMLLLVGGVWST